MNLSSLENNVLQVFKDAVQRKFGQRILDLKLFGSKARGEGHEESDLDVLVILNEVSLNDKHQIWDVAGEIFLETEINISPLVMSRDRFQRLKELERLLPEEIEREGIPL